MEGENVVTLVSKRFELVTLILSLNSNVQVSAAHIVSDNRHISFAFGCCIR